MRQYLPPHLSMYGRVHLPCHAPFRLSNFILEITILHRMVARLHSSSLYGVDALAVDVEVHVSNQGKEKFTIIGLGDSAIKESRERILRALVQSGFTVPDQVLVNLAPAEVKKEGSAFDLPIALGILVASRQLSAPLVRDRVFIGEVALDGSVKSVRGVLARVIAARELGIREAFVPVGSGEEASLVSDMRVFEVSSVAGVVAALRRQELTPFEPGACVRVRTSAKHLDDIVGQDLAKRAAVIAAAGGHNILLIGPPGCGKSMLAERFPALLPVLSSEQQREVIRIHGAADLPITALLNGERPYRAPHHVVSDVGLMGGGAFPRPGEVSLAHHGVLFLDEFPEFRRSALEALRAPLESGTVRISRAQASLLFPAQFQLVAAMNPCPCGRLGVSGAACTCSRSAIGSYLRKLSQPILDRIDLHVELEAVPLQVLTEAPPRSRTTTEDLQTRVIQAQKAQYQRQGALNRALSSTQIYESGRISPAAQKLLQSVAARGILSARGFVRVLRVAGTVADLEGRSVMADRDVAEALSFRSLDRLAQHAQVA